MKFLDKMERKFGKYAIHNISMVLIICYAFGYAIQFVNVGFLNYLTLDPYAILRGQIWRIFTWIIVPPSNFSFFTLLMLYFYYSIGTTLERTWGVFRYNVYLISGMIFTLFGSLLLYFFCQNGLLGGEYLIAYGENFYPTVARLFSTYYINMSIFLGFAATFPDMQVLLMFIIPIKVKWLGIIYALMLVYDFIFGNFVSRFTIGASLLNFVVFYLMTRNRISPKQIKRRHHYHKQMAQAAGVTKHKCAICGRTEKEYPDLEFRFCSKCDGNYEYCQDHLFTHEHIKRH